MPDLGLVPGRSRSLCIEVRNKHGEAADLLYLLSMILVWPSALSPVTFSWRCDASRVLHERTVHSVSHAHVAWKKRPFVIHFVYILYSF